jgi:anti-sigma factor (TIGR02949 family)
MTDCERNLDRISAFLDGELDAAETAELQRHLEACPSCRALQEDLMAVRAGLAEEMPELPEGLHEKIMDAVRAERKKPVGAAALRRRWGVLAAVLALVVITAAYGPDILKFAPKGTSDSRGMAEAASADSAPAERGMGAGEENGVFYTMGTDGGVESPKKEDQSKDSERSSTAQVSLAAPPPAAPADPEAEQETGIGDALEGEGYCVVLTVEGLPPELEGLAPEGVTEFTLPAAQFEDVVAQLAAREAEYQLERPEAHQEAETGLVIVLPAKE